MTNESEPPPSPLAVTLDDGTQAIAFAYERGTLSLACERAYPPGKPLALHARAGEQELHLQGKSGGSKRRADGRYDVMLRLVSLRREQRAVLERAFS